MYYINVFSVSGDGLLHEVFNGLFEREDWRVSCQVPVGVIIIVMIHHQHHHYYHYYHYHH